MKILLFISIIVFVLSCSSNKTEKTIEQSMDSIPELVVGNSFDNCFPKPDTNFEQTVIGCSGGYYKVVSDQYVIRINSDIKVDYGECIEIEIDSTESEMTVELLVFKKGDASLMNICTDIKISELNGKKIPEPISRIQKCYGKIVIGKTDPTDYYGNEMPKMTIRIEELTFIDIETKDTITFKDELLWKVLNTGTPG
ncbi:MAG: hypothetical protein K9J13_00145 [Saprospiraceae bacterium]|nr:hypothetical protein [Saprospiraceae bacterium]